jgi:predicted enzyme related to lactoylglutathione lyase
MQFNEFITFFGTEDLNTTSNFYQNILGLTLYKDQKTCLIFNINDKSKIGFCEHMTVVLDEKSPIITFVTEEVDETYSRLVNAGLHIADKPRTNLSFHIYHFFFKDPNGYTIEIQKFLD